MNTNKKHKLLHDLYFNLFYCEQQLSRAKQVRDFASKEGEQSHRHVVSLWEDRTKQLQSITETVVDVLTDCECRHD